MKPHPPSPASNPALLNAVAGTDPVVVLTGHYGVGKTNLALNLALAAAAAGEQVAVADLDLVNPYFRSSDYGDTLAPAGIRLVAPTFAGTALDTPSVGGQLFAEIERALAEPGRRLIVDAVAPTFAGTALDTPSVGGQLFAEIERALAEPGRRLIVDAGGDDAGATVLGSYAHALAGRPARVLHVLNAFRDLGDPREVVEVLHEVEGASRMAATGLVNVSHLMEGTTVQDVERGRVWAAEVAGLAGLPLVATCVPAHLAQQCYSDGTLGEPVASVGRYVLTPWQ